MRHVPLTQGLFAIVDDEDYDRVMQHKWHAVKCRYKVYAARRPTINGRRQHVPMQRFILGEPHGALIDHINGDGLDNRKGNLRSVTVSANTHNRPAPRDNTSGVKGVKWHKGAQKWMAEIRVHGRYVYLGVHERLEDAATARREAERELIGEYAWSGQ